MFKINRFDDWISDNTSGTYGSGASEKVWLINPITGNRGLFKFPKIKSDGNVTGEYCSEKIASELGNLIGMSCAKIDIGTYKGRIGSMSRLHGCYAVFAPSDCYLLNVFHIVF